MARMILPAKVETKIILVTFRHLTGDHMAHFGDNPPKPPPHGTFRFHSS